MKKKPKTKKAPKKKEVKIEKNPLKKALTLKQQRFCELYTGGIEFFGNGTASYIKAYNISKMMAKRYEGAKANASRLLGKIEILAYINHLLEKQGLNDQNVDKQLLFLLNQFQDWGHKFKAIHEYNLMKKRIQDRVELGEDTLTELKKWQDTNIAMFNKEKKK